MDKVIKSVLDELNKEYEAYLVGGYVRDYLLGIKTYDVDICTTALPKDIYSIFNICANNYGGSKLIVDNYNIDITTFRKDSHYNKRRPMEVEYITDLMTDLKRRDFTINTICMDKDGKIIDLLNGVNDLNNRTIKMIGDNIERLVEDPLRILRAIRFATVLDFNLDEELIKAIKKKYKLVNTLSKDRVKREFSKILMSPNYRNGLKLCDEFKISEELGIEYEDVVYTKDIVGMWVQVKISDIPFTNVEKSNIINITEIINYGTVNNDTLYKYGLYANLIAGMIMNISSKRISSMYKKLPIKDRSDIAIKGNEISDLLDIHGKDINIVYEDLKEMILHKRLKNKKGDIIKYLLKRK